MWLCGPGVEPETLLKADFFIGDTRIPKYPEPISRCLFLGEQQDALLTLIYSGRSRVGAMPSKKAEKVAPRLSEPEQDLLAHMERGYQLVTDLLGGDPVLRRAKDDEVIRPVSVNRNTINTLQEGGLITPVKGRDPLTTVWHLNKKKK